MLRISGLGSSCHHGVVTSSDMGVHALDTGPVPRNKLLAELPEAAPAILLAEADLIVIPEGRIF